MAMLLLPLAEIAAFIVVAIVIGGFWAACLFLATTVIGVFILRHTGGRDVQRFRTALARDGIAAVHLDSPGLGPMLGGILLVFPGFITDVLGALLLLPPMRRWLQSAIVRVAARQQQQTDRSVIDLTSKEWHQVSQKVIDDGRPGSHLP